MSEDAVFDAVRALINGHDPESLLQVGAPEDEYDAEVTDLVALVHSTAEITAPSVADIFSRWFGHSHWVANQPAEIAEVASRLEALRHEMYGRRPAGPARHRDS